MTFDEWFNDTLSEYAGDNDMRKHHISSRWAYEKAWQASQASQQSEIDALKCDLDGYMKIAHASATEIVQQEKTIAKLLEALKEVISANPTIVFDEPEAFKYVSSIEKARQAIAEAEGKEK